MPRNGSHYVASYLRRQYHYKGLLYPIDSGYNMELFGPTFEYKKHIEFFEYCRNHFNLDVFNIYHSTHLAENVYIPSRPGIKRLFDWFKEFYEGYPIIILRRRNIWKTYISWLFHNTIRERLIAFGEKDDDDHSWHSHNTTGVKAFPPEDKIKSLIETIKPNFTHDEHRWQNFIRDVKYYNDEIIGYYTSSNYNRTLVRDWWLEDLTDESLNEHFKYTDEDDEILVRQHTLKPFSIKYETYFGKELPIIRAKFKEVYETTFKPYGYVVD